MLGVAGRIVNGGRKQHATFIVLLCRKQRLQGCSASSAAIGVRLAKGQIIADISFRGVERERLLKNRNRIFKALQGGKAST